MRGVLAPPVALLLVAKLCSCTKVQDDHSELQKLVRESESQLRERNQLDAGSNALTYGSTLGKMSDKAQKKLVMEFYQKDQMKAWGLPPNYDERKLTAKERAHLDKVRAEIDNFDENQASKALGEAIELQAAEYEPPADDPVDDLARSQQARRNKITQNFNQMKGAEQQFLDAVNKDSKDGVYETGGAAIRDPSLGATGQQSGEPDEPEWYKKLEGEGKGGILSRTQNRFEIQDQRSGGKLSAYVQDQQKKTMDRLQTNAKRAHEESDKMYQKMAAQAGEFKQAFEDNIKDLNENLKKYLADMEEGFEPLDMTLIPGEGTDIDGNLLQPTAFEINMDEVDEPEVWASPGDTSGDSPISAGDGMIDLLIKECYQGIASGNRNQTVVDKNCLTADILTYKCERPIDASFYLGVSFDVKVGYNSEGFRGKIVKHWCREMNTYKGAFDVPDGMQIQGVYETKVSTETYSSVSDYMIALSEFSNTQSGNSAFQESQESLNTRTTTTAGESESSGGGFGGIGAGGSSYESTANSVQAADASITSNKKQSKGSKIEENITRNQNKTTKMVGEMAIKVIRYEMFLREVKPNYIHEDFLDCFLMLPQSYFSPRAPERFQDFILRYGTHYVKAAKFGGQLKVVKTKTISDSADVTDFRKEIQTQVNEIVGNAMAKQRAEQSSKSVGKSFQASFALKGVSAGGGNAQSKSGTASTKKFQSEVHGSASSNVDSSGNREVGSNKKKRVMDSTIMEVSGGSHKIATAITDLYSVNFRSALVQWLYSIPQFPKPFDFVFEPITKMLKHMVDDMIDPEMFKTCLVDKKEYHILPRIQQVSCGTQYAQTSEKCVAFCTNATAESICPVSSPRRLDCREIVQQKERFKRKVDALETAIDLYLVESGELGPKNNLEIPAQAPGCTRAYRIGRPFDDFDLDYGESDVVDWVQAAFGDIQLTFDFKKFFFNKPNAGIITPNQIFIMYFDGRDRRWYTKDHVSDALLPSMASQEVPFSELKSEATAVAGQYKLIPRPIVDDDDQPFVMIRLKMGLYVDVNLNTKDVSITPRSIAAMRASSDTEVAVFLTEYADIIAQFEGAVDGELVGFIDPITIDESKTPFPCRVAWSNNQQFESTDDINQCIKVTIKTGDEYFFVMAASRTDPSSWIYVHQTQSSLCIHKLNGTTGENEINACAERLQYMTSGKIEDMPEQLYVCVYRQGSLLSISLKRPTFSRLDRVSAIAILTYNYVQEEGENVFPRYYAVAAGESSVEIKNIYMVEIETLQCQLPFMSQKVGGTWRCVLQCHDQCDPTLGCNRPNDNSACLACRYSTFIQRYEDRPDTYHCVEDCNKANNKKLVIIPHENEEAVCSECHHQCKEGCRDNGLTEYDCTGLNPCENYKYYDVDENGDRLEGNPWRCIKECPEGTWIRTKVITDADTIQICEPCPAGCKRCNLGDEHKQADGSVETVNPAVRYTDTADDCVGTDGAGCNEYDICLECKDFETSGVLTSVYNIKSVTCKENKCPLKYQRRGNECRKAWRVIGYQTTKDTLPFATEDLDVNNINVTSGRNFLLMGTDDDFEKYKVIDEHLEQTTDMLAIVDNSGVSTPATYRDRDFTQNTRGLTPSVYNTHGVFSFQLAWKVDSSNVYVLEWRQNFNPLRTYGQKDPYTCKPCLMDVPAAPHCDPSDPVSACLPTDRRYEIENFRRHSCKVTDPAQKSVKTISFTSNNFFVNCPEMEVTSFNNVPDECQSETGETIQNDMKLLGFGQDENTDCPTGKGLGGLVSRSDKLQSILQVMNSPVDIYTFGQLAPITGTFIKAFQYDSPFYSDEMQLSVDDRRAVPIGWSSWQAEAYDVDTNANVATECVMDCTSRLTSQRKERHCRCYDAESTGSVITDDPTQSATDLELFELKCQPCEGLRFKYDNCTLAECEANTVLTTSNAYFHHGCCDDSSAIRIIGKNKWAADITDTNSLSFNGLYELKYSTTDGEHEYIHLKRDDSNTDSTNKIVRKTHSVVVDTVTVTNTYWVIQHTTSTSKTNFEVMRSSFAACPQDAQNWGVLGIDWPSNYDTVANPAFDRIDDVLAREAAHSAASLVSTEIPIGYPDFNFICSTGRNACPFEYPYSYDRGERCCISPFEANGADDDAATLNMPANMAPSLNLLTPDSTACFGESTTGVFGDTDTSRKPYVMCENHYADRRCRSNLDNVLTRTFKGLSNKKWTYDFARCEKHCGSVYMKATIAP